MSVEGQITPQRGAAIAMAVHEPMGVVAAITPWNSPLTIEAQKLAPALAARKAAVLSGLPNSARTCQQEIFGPVAVVLPIADEDDLVARAIDTAFGLVAGVWFRHSAKAWRIALAVRSGTVGINICAEGTISTPFGGVRESGIGREKGLAGLRAYCQPKGIFRRLA